MDLEQKIRNYIFNELVSGTNPEEYGNDHDLLENGVLDSLAIVQLVTHLENVYEIEVEAGDIVPENISSIKRLANFVNSKLAKPRV